MPTAAVDNSEYQGSNIYICDVRLQRRHGGRRVAAQRKISDVDPVFLHSTDFTVALHLHGNLMAPSNARIFIDRSAL